MLQRQIALRAMQTYIQLMLQKLSQTSTTEMPNLDALGNSAQKDFHIGLFIKTTHQILQFYKEFTDSKEVIT